MDTEAPDDQVAHERRRERRDDRVVADPADRLHLEGKDTSRERNTEHRSEAAGDRRDQQQPPVGRPHAGDAGEAVGEASRHLQCRPLPPGASTEQMGEDGSDEHQRRHPAGHPRLRIVDLVDDQVVPLDGSPAAVVVREADREPGEGETSKEPRVCLPGLGRPAKRLEEDRGGEAREDSDHRTEDDPSTEVGEQLRLLSQIESQQAPQSRVHASAPDGPAPTFGSRRSAELGDPGVCCDGGLVAVVEVTPLAQTDGGPLGAIHTGGERVTCVGRRHTVANRAIVPSSRAASGRGSTRLDEPLHLIRVRRVEATPTTRAVMTVGAQPAPRTTARRCRMVSFRSQSSLTHFSSNRRATAPTGWDQLPGGAPLPDVAAAISVGAISPGAVMASSIANAQPSGPAPTRAPTSKLDSMILE